MKFRDKFQLNFPLLADADHKVAEKYGAWREKNMYGKKSMGIQRSTFLIDRRRQNRPGLEESQRRRPRRGSDRGAQRVGLNRAAQLTTQRLPLAAPQTRSRRSTHGASSSRPGTLR